MDSFSVRAEAEKVDPRASLRHVLASEDGQYPDPTTADVPIDWSSLNAANQFANGSMEQNEDVEGTALNTAMTTTTRRNASGSVSSVYSGNRIRFLKKDDGQPLWRKDIQYLFLRIVFEDDSKVFTKASDGTTEHTFADIYIDAMAKSSKCSQILKEKLLTDRASALQMAMICLLVNVGRMNTTLNFFPEMRARVRTYHSIPCLQAQQGAQAYKQLQDGPRLKSILKGATEDVQQPGTIDDIIRHPKPRTNPVNLIFVLSQYAPKISETHFFPPRDFFDLFMRSTLSSQSRARAFLWLVWWYLESDFSIEDSQQNPFGRGMPGEDGSMPTKVPPLDVLTEEQAEAENVDTVEELTYGEAKRREREAIVANDMPPTANAPKRGQKTAIMEHQHNYRFRHSPFGSSASDSGGSRGRPSPSPPPEPRSMERPSRQRAPNSDGDQTRSPSPPTQTAPRRKAAAQSEHLGVLINSLLNEDASEPQTTRSKISSNSSRRNASRSKSRQKPSNSTHPQEPLDPDTEAPTSSSKKEVPYDPDHFRSRPSQLAFQRYYQHELPLSNFVSANPVRTSQSSFSGPPYPYHRPVVTSPDPPSGNRKVRPAPTLEQSRRERVSELLHEQMHRVRKEKRRERRRQGVLVDAWIKCNTLPDGWDSDEDDRCGLGGLDDFGADDAMNENGRSDHAARDDDIGDQSRRIVNGLRGIGMALDGIVIPRAKNFSFKGDTPSLPFPSAILPSENGMPLTTFSDSGRELNTKHLLPSQRHGLRLVERLVNKSDDEAHLAPKRKKPTRSKPPRKSQPTSTSKKRASPAIATGSRKSRRTVRKSSKSLDENGLRRGQLGVPADEFFAGQDAGVGDSDLRRGRVAASRSSIKSMRGESREKGLASPATVRGHRDKQPRLSPDSEGDAEEL